MAPVLTSPLGSPGAVPKWFDSPLPVIMTNAARPLRGLSGELARPKGG